MISPCTSAFLMEIQNPSFAWASPCESIKFRWLKFTDAAVINSTFLNMPGKSASYADACYLYFSRTDSQGSFFIIVPEEG